MNSHTNAQRAPDNLFTRRRPGVVAAYSAATVLLFVLPGAAAALIDRWWLCIPLWLVQGAALVSFSHAAHECTHGLYVSGRLWNRVCGSLWMLPLLLNFGVHRRYHLRHHSYTSRPGDPEYNFEYASFRGVGAYLKAAARWLVVPTPVHRLNWRETVRACRGRASEFVQNERDRSHVRWNALLLVAWAAAAALATWQWPWLLKAYWVPLVFFFPLVTWYTALPEHYGVEPSQSALHNTRSVYAGGLLSRAFWNINFHTAHHYAPSVPFHNLPALDASLRPGVVLSAPSYFSFHARLLAELTGRARGEPGRVEG